MTEVAPFAPFATNVKNFLSEFKAASPVFPHLYTAVITVSNDQTLWNALQTLVENKILSAPVVDASNRKVVGSFSMKDFMNILVSRFDEKELQMVSEQEFKSLLEKKGIANKRLTEFEEIGKLEPTFTVMANEPLLKAVEIMVNTRAQRVIVLNDSGQLVNVITQSRVVAILTTMLDTIPDASKTLQELKLGFKPLITLPNTLSTFQAFKLLRDKNATALPVVDEKGKLIGNLSVNDLKILGYKLEWFKLLTLPLSEYLNELKKPERASVVRRKEIQQPLTVKPDDTLEFTMKMLYVWRVHRVYIVNDEGVPIGVEALHDVIKHVTAPYLPKTEATE
jgi:5'-AMP-activated protein kinase, regulatory gamma subunit